MYTKKKFSGKIINNDGIKASFSLTLLNYTLKNSFVIGLNDSPSPILTNMTHFVQYFVLLFDSFENYNSVNIKKYWYCSEPNFESLYTKPLDSFSIPSPKILHLLWYRMVLFWFILQYLVPVFSKAGCRNQVAVELTCIRIHVYSDSLSHFICRKAFELTHP